MSDNTPAHDLTDENVRNLMYYGKTEEVREAASWVMKNRERLAAAERKLDEELGIEVTP
jgi:hypothetical protein